MLSPTVTPTVSMTPSNDVPISIRAEPSAVDPDSCRFSVSRTVHRGGPYVFRAADEARGSPLAERLFALGGVRAVMVTESVVTVEKDAETSWRELAARVGGAIREQLQSGEAALADLRAGFVKVRPDAELEQAARKTIDEEVNPGVASHGGQIHVEGVRERNLYLRLSGGCQGCAASQVTLKQGVETVIRKALPEIENIIDVTDHGAGTHPFYAS